MFIQGMQGSTHYEGWHSNENLKFPRIDLEDIGRDRIENIGQFERSDLVVTCGSALGNYALFYV